MSTNDCQRRFVPGNYKTVNDLNLRSTHDPLAIETQHDSSNKMTDVSIVALLL